MNTQSKTILKSALFSGIFFAIFMAGIDLIQGQDFHIWKFLIHALGVGVFTALSTRYSLNKLKSKNE